MQLHLRLASLHHVVQDKFSGQLAGHQAFFRSAAHDCFMFKFHCCSSGLLGLVAASVPRWLFHVEIWYTWLITSSIFGEILGDAFFQFGDAIFTRLDFAGRLINRFDDWLRLNLL